MRKHLWVILLAGLLPMAASATVIDNFEDGNITEWQQAVSYDPVGASVTTAAAHGGTYGLSLYSMRTGWLMRIDDLAQITPGMGVCCWTQLNNSTWTRNYFGFGASTAGCYSAVLGDNTNTFILQLNSGYGYADLASVPYIYINRYWYRCEVLWGAGGALTANLYDSDGVTLLATVSAVNSTYSSGGIAARTFGDSGDPGYWDDFVKHTGPTPVEEETWGGVKALFR